MLFQVLVIIFLATYSTAIILTAIDLFYKKKEVSIEVLFPEGAYAIRDLGKSWHSFKIKIDFAEHKFLMFYDACNADRFAITRIDNDR